MAGHRQQPRPQPRATVKVTYKQNTWHVDPGTTVAQARIRFKIHPTVQAWVGGKVAQDSYRLRGGEILNFD